MGHYYNEPWKTAYLEDVIGSDVIDRIKDTKTAKEVPIRLRNKYFHATSTFKQIAEFEEKADTDFARFTDDDMKGVYLSFGNKFTYNTLKQKYSDLRGYITWCSNTGRISLNELRIHPLYNIYIDGYRWDRKEENGLQYRSKRLREQQKAIEEKQEEAHDGKVENYIFETPEGLFKYFDTVFEDPKYLMCKTALILIYYGFSNADIETIRIEEVNELTHEVRGVKIDDVPFKTIATAKNTNDTMRFKKEDGRTFSYKNTGYLIRSCKSNGMIGHGYLKNLKSLVNKATKELRVDSPYKNVDISINWLSKQKEFHRVLKYEAGKTEQEIVEILKTTQKYDLQYPDYLTMAAKAKDI